MADISTELGIILNSRFGRDIRHAIHDALEKLSGGEPSSSLINIKLTRAEYDALDTKSNTTVYYVVETSGLVNEYLGDVLINRGGLGSEPLIAPVIFLGNEAEIDPESGEATYSDVEYDVDPSPYDPQEEGE